MTHYTRSPKWLLTAGLLLLLTGCAWLSFSFWTEPVAAQTNPQWPDLAKQLAADAVAAGSALEQLIRANQNFAVLHPQEFNDKLRLPLWLRVWWRREHPEWRYNPNDPSGGYPLALKEIREWMRYHQNLRPGAGQSNAREEEGKDKDFMAVIGGDLRISGAQSTPRSESAISINPWNPQRIISASNNISGGGNQAQFYSTDGGLNWGQTNLPLTGGDGSHSDPTADWTSDGTAWSTTLGITGGVLRGRAYKSTDNGATWTLDGTFSGSQTAVDKQMTWVDRSNTSPFKDRLYVIWHNNTPAFINHRTPGAGGAWQTPLQVSGAESTGTAIGNDIKTNADGHVFGFWPTTGNQRIFVVKSTNGGASFGTPVQIATTFDSFDIGVPSFNSRRALIYVAGGAYKTAAKNLVYATWTDLSGATGCTAPANEPGANVASACKTRIWFARSLDGGATWAAKTMINNQAGLNDQFNQWLAVDEASGALGVIYYDTVGDAGRRKTDIWYQSSFDDGATWTTAQKVTSAQTDETMGGQDTGNQFGDYNSLSVYAGVLFASWTDRRNGAREEIWTAKITDPACTAPGAPTIGAATAIAPNQIQVTWTDGAPTAARFNVYRAVGTCAAPGSFVQIATGVTGASYTDTTVSGGTTYSYRITGADATGACESPPSACAQATATGACTLPPTFAGLNTVTNPQSAFCTLNLNWTAATANCGGPVSYNIYRTTSAGFTPSLANRIATGVSGASYSDNQNLTSGATYYYIVRAVDGANSAEDANTVTRSGAPTGPIVVNTFTETFEGAQSGGGFDNAGWTHQALTGATDWVWSTAQAQTPTHSWFSDSQTSVSSRILVSPGFVAQANTTLSFWHTYAFEGTVAQGYDGGTLEYTIDGGTNWMVVPDAAFTAGGFNGTINSNFSNPLAGKRAWVAGTIGAMTQVTVNLSSFNGQTLKLRWHEGDDSSAQATGWYVDSVTITNAGLAQSCTTGSGVPNGPLAFKNAASYDDTEFAVESVVAAFGNKLAATLLSASVTPLPTALNGASVNVRDSANVDRAAGLYFIAPDRLNFQVPAGTAPGLAQVTINGPLGYSTGTITAAAVAPGLFSADGSGAGVMKGYALRTNGATQTIEQVAQFNPVTCVWEPLPLVQPTNQVTLVLLGTGFRNRAALPAVMVGGVSATVISAAASTTTIGFDELHVQLPALTTGLKDIAVTVDGKPANLVKVQIQ
jgi:uncharacterized protein (TIGR03437 family)